ncbi:MAG: hypothetical protein LBH46_02195 [Rickettsiales bacterium]|jgi:opacity protein-like surface antigen|nr:hypothetical protein [Rickettsiales bacterium]
MFRKNVWIVNVVTILLFNTNIINAEEIKENIEEVKGYFFIGTSLNQVNFNIGEKSGGGKNLAGFRFGFGSKQKFSVRTEGELNFQNSYKSEISTRFYDVKFNLDIFAYNVNAYFDYDMENSNFKPYWGIGSGLTFIGGKIGRAHV